MNEKRTRKFLLPPLDEFLRLWCTSETSTLVICSRHSGSYCAYYLKGENGCARADAPRHKGFVDASALERIADVVLISAANLAKQHQHLSEEAAQRMTSVVRSDMCSANPARLTGRITRTDRAVQFTHQETLIQLGKTVSQGSR